MQPAHPTPPSSETAPPPRAILFDLGGILVLWDGVEPLVALSGGRLGGEEARKFWLESPSVRAFERGRCSPEEFATGVVEELGLRVRPEEFLAAFASWDRGPLPGAVELLDELRGKVALACLSNNNEIHWRRLRDEFGLGARFERCYLSHEIGRVKPDSEAFEHVIADLGLPPATIIFLDDSPECVAAARRLGLRAHEARGVEGARTVLRALGMLA